MGFTTPPNNPALPASANRQPPSSKDGSVVEFTAGTGAERIFPDVRNRPPEFGHPPRPIPGSVADLDKVFEHCDFSAGKVRSEPTILTPASL